MKWIKAFVVECLKRGVPLKWSNYTYEFEFYCGCCVHILNVNKLNPVKLKLGTYKFAVGFIEYKWVLKKLSHSQTCILISVIIIMLTNFNFYS